MDQKRALAALVEGLRIGMEANRFSFRVSLFVRENNEKQDIVQPAAVRKSQGRIGLLYGARVRFPVLEQLIRGDEAADSYSGSYGGLSHLVAGEGYYDWTIETPETILEVSEAIFSNIELVALPFFESHLGLGDLLESLCVHKRGLALSAEDQVVYRAGALWLLDHRDEARAVLLDALEERRDALPKKRDQIEGLLRKLT